MEYYCLRHKKDFDTFYIKVNEECDIVEFIEKMTNTACALVESKILLRDYLAVGYEIDYEMTQDEYNELKKQCREIGF